MECTKCKSWCVRRVFIRGSHEMLLALLTIFPFRCQLCRHRFLAFAGRITAGPRREYQRVSARYPVTIKGTDSSGQTNGKEKGKTGVLVDLSIQGCGIACKMPLKVEEKVCLSIKLTEYDFPLEVDQAIVRTQENERVGLEFVKVSPDHEERLRRIIERQLTDAVPGKIPLGRVPV